jgi:hypothetical protein
VRLLKHLGRCLVPIRFRTWPPKSCLSGAVTPSLEIMIWLDRRQRGGSPGTWRQRQLDAILPKIERSGPSCLIPIRFGATTHGDPTWRAYPKTGGYETRTIRSGKRGPNNKHRKSNTSPIQYKKSNTIKQFQYKKAVKPRSHFEFQRLGSKAVEFESSSG